MTNLKRKVKRARSNSSLNSKLDAFNEKLVKEALEAGDKRLVSFASNKGIS